jgi:hypothetical protein
MKYITKKVEKLNINFSVELNIKIIMHIKFNT